MATFSGKSSYPSDMISLRYFTCAIVCHKLVSTPRAWGMNSPVTHILTPWKILIGLPGTSCEPIYLAGSRKYQTALCFPFLRCPGNLWFWNFLWMLTASIMHQQQRHVATRAQSCQSKELLTKKILLTKSSIRKEKRERKRERKGKNRTNPTNAPTRYNPPKPCRCWEPVP